MDVGRFASLRVSQAPGVLALEEEFHNVMQSLSHGENPVPSFLLALRRTKEALDNELGGEGLGAEREAAASRQLRLEVNTWCLLSKMHEHEESGEQKPATDADADADADGSFEGDFESASKAVMAYIARSPERQRQQVLLRWLEESAPDPCRRDAGGNVMWAVTLHEMQAQLQRGRGGLSLSPASTAAATGLHSPTSVSFDADATVRDGLEIAPEDEEENLLLTVWQCVRAGQLKLAVAHCEERGQPWRAASLLGGVLEGEGGGQEGGGGLGVGHARRPLWKETCWRLATSGSGSGSGSGSAAGAGAGALAPDAAVGMTDNDGADAGLGPGPGPGTGAARESDAADNRAAVLERATYAALAGHVDALLASPLCATWEDRLWVYFRAAHERVADEALGAVRRQQQRLFRGDGPVSDSMWDSMLGHGQRLSGQTCKGLIDEARRTSGDKIAGARSSSGPHRHYRVQEWLMRPWGRRQLQGLVVDVLVQLAAKAYEALLSPAEQHQHRLALLAEAQALAGDHAHTHLGPDPALGLGLGGGGAANAAAAATTARAHGSDADALHFLRFAAHVVLYSAAKEGGPKAVVTDPAGQDTIKFYVQTLIKRRQASFVALYCARLEPALRQQLYLHLLRKTLAEDEARRVHCLQLGFEHMHLDMLPVLEYFCKGDTERDNAQYWAQQPADDAVPGNSSALEARVDSVRWFCYDLSGEGGGWAGDERRVAELLVAAVQHSNRLCRHIADCLVQGESGDVGIGAGAQAQVRSRLAAMQRLLVNVLPANTSERLRALEAQEGGQALVTWLDDTMQAEGLLYTRFAYTEDEDAPEATSPLTSAHRCEHQCWVYFLAAQLAYEEWWLAYSASNNGRGAGALSRVKDTLVVAMQQLLAALLCEGGAEGGFLRFSKYQEGRPPIASDEQWAEETRRHCVRCMVRQLHDLYFRTGQCLLAVGAQHGPTSPEASTAGGEAVEMFQQSLNISSLVATEHHQLYDAYDSEQLQELLALMHKSKLALLQCAEWGFKLA